MDAQVDLSLRPAHSHFVGFIKYENCLSLLVKKSLTCAVVSISRSQVFSTFFQQADYEFSHLDYEKLLMCLLSRKERNSMIINTQSLFLFINSHCSYL